MMESNVETLRHVSRAVLLKTILINNWEEACTLTYNDETYARIPDDKGNLPLHLAVRLGCIPRLAQLLLVAFPESITIRDSEGFLPFHLAVCHHRGRLWVNMNELTLILYRAYPKALREVDSEGNCPLHLSIRSRGPDEMIKFLIDCDPSTLKVPDARGNLPLHLGIQFDASYITVFYMLKSFEGALSTPNNTGSCPLHKVTYFNSHFDIFDAVLSAFPGAASMKDKNGNLPMHLAFFSAGGPPEERKLKKLLAANPGALSIRNAHGLNALQMFNRPQEMKIEDYM